MCRSTSESICWLALNALERIAAFLILVAISPVLIAVAVIVAALSGCSPLIAHRRLGLGGTPFWVLKFRTMWPRRAPLRGRLALVEYIVDQDGPQRKTLRDSRISSAFARFCRRHSIDELPQFLHVVRGEMSLVGPRPITPFECSLHYRGDAAEVLGVKPGISGLWQIMGRSGLTYQQRRNLDLELVRNRSLKLYVRILLGTLPAVFSGRGAW
jgi:lipopolysaccharide/colanic/teichoic acid biosynthesis glycosyltransferase